jgi:RHS repeat-associated protein
MKISQNSGRGGRDSRTSSQPVFAAVGKRCPRTLRMLCETLFALCVLFGLAGMANAQCVNPVWTANTDGETGSSAQSVGGAEMAEGCSGPGNTYQGPASCPIGQGSEAACDAIYNCTAGCLCQPPACSTTQVIPLAETVQMSGQPAFSVTATPPQKCCANMVGHPINPAAGEVYEVATDISLPSPGRLLFQRYYDSGSIAPANLGPQWRTSYTRQLVIPPGGAPVLPYVAGSVTSPLYWTQATACTVGFNYIKSVVAEWANASTSWNGASCSLSTGGTIQVNSNGPLYGQVTLSEIDAYRDDGQMIRFPVVNGAFVPSPGVSLRLAAISGGYTLTDDDDVVETYNSTGQLQSIKTRAGVVQTVAYDASNRLSTITDSFGHALALAYNASNQLATITADGTAVVQYAHDSSGRLSVVTNADSTSTTYVYENSSFPNALTGLIDESANRYMTWGYNTSGQAVSAQSAGGAGAVTVSYPTSNTATVTDALGAVRTFTYTRQGDRALPSSISGSQCPTCVEGAATTYDASGFVASRTDYNGNLTCYFNNGWQGLELARVEGFAPGSTCPSNLANYTPAAGTAQRKVVTFWHQTYRLPTQINEFDHTTTFTYDASGNMLTKTVTDTTVTPNTSRTWTYTYDSYGQVLTAKGPRTDVNDTTTYVYYNCSTGARCGGVNTVTNSLSQVTTFNTYNVHGQPLTITDPNGIVTTLAYDARQRLMSRQISTETTGFSYYPTGRLKTVTLPDSSTVTYSYDNAHRLNQIQDGAGNKISYTLDAAGNRTAESHYDPTSVLSWTHTWVYNTLSQMYQDIASAGTSAVTTTYGYDANGNQTSIDAPLARNTTDVFDPLNRLAQVTDPNSGVTKFSYDGDSNLLSVLDPRSLTTSYTYNGFGDLATLASPDTGTTTNTYDSGGNLATAKDARVKTATYTYDANERLTQAAYGDETISYTYDAGTNGKGRLTGAADSSHSMTWAYDALGRVHSKSQIVAGKTLTLGYAYTNGDLTTVTTPSGQTLTYTYSNHRITGITVNAASLLSSVTYEPFGLARGWTWGNATTEIRLHNEDGNASQISAIESTAFAYDSALRLTGTTNSSNNALSWTYGYDVLDRLTSAVDTGTTEGWTYDANGNRLTETGAAPGTYTVSATSNRLSSISGTPARTYGYDADGNVATYASNTFTFNNRGRMASVKVSSTTTSYVYNAIGQRIEKSGGPAGTVLFMYDEAGHLIGEYTSTAALVQETVWLGDLPVATLRPHSGGGIDIYYVHADQLGAPRMVTRATDNGVMWRWDTEPFGATAPNANPKGLGTFAYNLRFPGQYYDSETGLLYNYFRDYDPQTGRYVESDPIGLAGGVNTFGYVRGNPVNWADPFGLKDNCGCGKHLGMDWGCLWLHESIWGGPLTLIFAVGSAVGVITFAKAPNPASAGLAITGAALAAMTQKIIISMCTKCVPD